jgi:uncharacterized protein YecE (DUF72 family)
VDEPHLKGLMLALGITTSKIGYVRFHGRNLDKWWKHENAYERYDYLYSEAELREWIDRIQVIAEKSEKTFVMSNNHYQGQSVTNAKMMERLLSLENVIS